MTRWQELTRLAAHWVLPPGILAFLRSHLMAKSLTQEEGAILRKNRALNNRHVGERCFILATGPSIKKQDLKLLRGETCIALSNFFVTQGGIAGFSEAEARRAVALAVEDVFRAIDVGIPTVTGQVFDGGVGYRDCLDALRPHFRA